jgi:hypothetical protein
MHPHFIADQAAVCSRVFYISVRFDDTIYRADADALRGIVMTLAFDAGGLVDDI